MEMRVQVLHSGVVAMGWVMVWRWFNKVWLEKVVAEQVRASY